MKKINTRFGEVEYDPESILHFPTGLVGLPHLKNFVVMPNKKEGPLFWIQSVDDPQMAFILTDPTNFFLEYKVIPDTNEQSTLGVTSSDNTLNLSVVTVSPAKEITLNLAAPIIYSPQTNKAIQVILEGSDYSSQAKLPDVDNNKG